MTHGRNEFVRTHQVGAPVSAGSRERAGRVKGAPAASVVSGPLTRPSAPGKWTAGATAGHRLFDFSQAPKVSATQIRELADGGYIARTEPVVLIGDCGTGKTHLLTGLCVAACRQKRRVRFTTAAALVNELVEAKHAMQLARVLARWARYDVIAIDEVGYVPLADVGAELLFQIIADRTERAALILTTNLPFSEWTQVIPNARLCKAVLDRITDRAHIIDTGHESYRFRRTIEKRQKKG